jgi:arsenite-transporting ATPase
VFREKFKSVPTFIESSSNGGELWALEIDPSQAIEEFKSSTVKDIAGGDNNPFAAVPTEMNFIDFLFDPNDPPPGIDELAAVSKVVSFLEAGYTNPQGKTIQFDRIVLDTAPTGHSLKMLSLPEFVNNLINSLRKATEKLSAISNMFQNEQQQRAKHLMNKKLSELQQRMKNFEEMLKNPAETEFTVVTIPTEMAVAETKRLLESLKEKDVLVRRLIMNQIIEGSETQAFLDAAKRGQAAVMDNLTNLSKENSLPLIQIPYFPVETRTVHALRHVGEAIFPSTSGKSVKN